MNGFLDAVLVGGVLLAGFGYAIYALGPKSLRARFLTASASLLSRLPAAAAGGLAQRLAAAAGTSAGSCGGCDNCGSDAAGDAAAAPRAAPDVVIPVAKIGRRRRTGRP